MKTLNMKSKVKAFLAKSTNSSWNKKYTNLQWHSSFWVNVISDDDVVLHAHTLPYTDVVEQRRLLCGYRHVNDDNISVVEQVENRRLAKV